MIPHKIREVKFPNDFILLFIKNFSVSIGVVNLCRCVIGILRCGIWDICDVDGMGCDQI